MEAGSPRPCSLSVCALADTDAAAKVTTAINKQYRFMTSPPINFRFLFFARVSLEFIAWSKPLHALVPGRTLSLLSNTNIRPSCPVFLLCFRMTEIG